LTLRIGMIAGELSGDQLGAGLIRALRAVYPDALIEGIGGPQMQAAGFHSHYPLETLSVMGLVEVLTHYPQLKRCRDALRQHFLAHRPAVFIGIDAPDFNLGLEQQFKAAGIPTVHYVSPSVWAWRAYRLTKIARACDLMLTLFPFEADYYQRHQVPVRFVGHPLADRFPLAVAEHLPARAQLDIATNAPWVALLPGSRRQELQRLTIPFVQTAQWLHAQRPQLRFLVALANDALRAYFQQQLRVYKVQLPLTLVTAQSHTVMAAADVVLTASGTATLEAMLLKRPLVVAYRLAPLTYQIAKRLVHIPYFSLPNLLAQKPLVPELLQHQVSAQQLGPAVLHWLDQPSAVERLQNQFVELHQSLRQAADQQAAQAVVGVIQGQ